MAARTDHGTDRSWESWDKVLDISSKKLVKDGRLQAFGNLTTNEDRVMFCLADEGLRNLVTEYLHSYEPTTKCWKSIEGSRDFRIEGNKAFQKKMDGEALNMYNLCIRNAPQTGNIEDIALGYANRSAVLYHLEKYEACLRDTKRALELNYPTELCYKLHMRRAQCFLRLNDNMKAMHELELAQSLLERSTVDEAQEMRVVEDIRSLMKEALNCTGEPVELGNKPPNIQISYGQHPKISFASSAMDLRCTAEKGRHLVANRNIKVGDTLFSERPYAAVQLPEMYNKLCHNCHDTLVDGVPCITCTQVLYCSEECRDIALKLYHSIECGHILLMASVGIAHLSLRTVLQTGVNNLLSMRGGLDTIKSPSGVPGLNELDMYESSYYTTYHLLPHSEDIRMEDNFHYAMTALLLLLFLDSVLEEQRDNKINVSGDSLSHQIQDLSLGSLNSSGATGMLDLIQLRFLGGLLLRHVQQLICNAHAINAVQFTSGEFNTMVETEDQVRMATAVFPTASLMNHSCEPNIINCFYKDNLVIKAVRDIAEGEEILNCYGPHYRRMSFKQRQKSLLEQYFFTCKCSACSNESTKQDKFWAYRCPLCEEPVSVVEGLEDLAHCPKCNKTHDSAKFLKDASEAEDLFRKGAVLIEKSNYTEALGHLTRSLCLRQSCLFRHHRLLGETHDQLARCYAMLGSFESSIPHLERSLECTREMYGIRSVETGHELNKYTDVLLQMVMQYEVEKGSNPEALRMLIKEIDVKLNEIHSIFSQNYGEWHSICDDADKKRQHLNNISQMVESLCV